TLRTRDNGMLMHVLLPVFALLYALLRRFTEIVTGIYIRPDAQIGAGLYMPHFGGIVLGGKLGRKCDVYQAVTVGHTGRPGQGHPVIGDRVYIGPGAKLFGSITIGNDVAIGANAVVTKSVPDRAVVVGVPARIISYKGSFDLVMYPGMETDPERTASMALVARV